MFVWAACTCSHAPSVLQCFGTFEAASQAARTYDLAVHHIYGEDAVLNFPLIEYLDRETGKLKPQWAEQVPEAAKVAKENGAKRKGHGRSPPSATPRRKE
jgi:hypothetical protein